jgi:hypothetical protein
MRVADLVFAVILVVTFFIYFYKTRSIVLNGDDWATAPRGNTFIDYFKPYQQNLSVTPIVVYHFVFTVFGFGTYWPLRFAGIASHMAVALTIFLIVRSRWGSAVALVAAVVILWYPIALLTPSLFNHWLALTGCLIAGWALTLKPGRSDWIAAGALVFALCGSGVGVAGAAGCLAYVTLTKAPLRRWLAIGIPVGLFVVWWFTLAADGHGQNTHQSLVDHVRYFVDGVTYSLQLFEPGGRWLGIPLTILFVAGVAWQLRGGIRAAAMGLSWSLAIVVWWTGLAITRAGATTGVPDAFRYRVVTYAFAVLALLPLGDSAKFRRLTANWRALGVALATVIALIAVNAPGIFRQVDKAAANYRQQAAKMIVLNLGPSVVPDDVLIHFDPFTSMRARRYRAFIDRYGEVEGTNPDHPDSAVVRLTGVKPVPVDADTTNCTALRGENRVPLRVDGRRGINPKTTVVLHAPSTDVTVQVRRFEQSWVTVGRIPAGTTAAMDLPILSAQVPWQLRADGACEVPG